jgi:hypothetical protein
MRGFTTILLVVTVHAVAHGCPLTIEQLDRFERWGIRFISGSASDRLALYRDGRGILPPRPTFYERRRDSELPEFRRADGSLIPYTAPYPIAQGRRERRIDVHVDEGFVIVSYPSDRSRVHTYYIDATIVPRTRSTRFERDKLGDWLHVDTDAVALRIEERDRAVKIQFKTDSVLFDATAAKVTALYADGREETIFCNRADRVADAASMRGHEVFVDKPVVDKPAIAKAQCANTRWLHALLLIASLFGCIAIACRISVTTGVARAE